MSVNYFDFELLAKIISHINNFMIEISSNDLDLYNDDDELYTNINIGEFLNLRNTLLKMCCKKNIVKELYDNVCKFNTFLPIMSQLHILYKLNAFNRQERRLMICSVLRKLFLYEWFNNILIIDMDIIIKELLKRF